MKKIGLKVTTVALTLGLAAAGISPAAASGTLSGGGATFQTDFQDKCRSRFNSASSTVNKGINVTYAGVGSGDGRTGLGGTTYAFAGSDSMGTAGTLTADNSVWMPVAVAPLAILVNLKSSTNVKISALRLDAATIEGIYTGSITQWNADEIKALNPSVKLPSKAIGVVVRSDKSGSTGNFKSYLKQNVPSSSLTAGEETNSQWKSGVLTGTGSSAVIATVGAEDGRIGYADLSDTIGVTSSVKVSLKNKYGQFIVPSTTGAANYIKGTGVLTANGNKKDSKGAQVTNNGGVYDLDFTKSIKDGYQLSMVTYMVGNKSKDNADFKVYAQYVYNKCAANPSSITATGYTTIGANLITVAKAQISKL